MLPQVLVCSLELDSFFQGMLCKDPSVAILLQSWAGWHMSHFPCVYKAQGVGGCWGRQQQLLCNGNPTCSAGLKSCACFSFSQILLFTSILFHFLIFTPDYVILGLKPDCKCMQGKHSTSELGHQSLNCLLVCACIVCGNVGASLLSWTHVAVRRQPQVLALYLLLHGQ